MGGADTQQRPWVWTFAIVTCVTMDIWLEALSSASERGWSAFQGVFVTGMANSQSDSEIGKDPDRESFEACFGASADSLRVLAAAEVGRSDADDVLQEAAIVGMRKFGSYQPGTNFRAWMSAIVRLVASNHRRGRRRREARVRRMSTLGRHSADIGVGAEREGDPRLEHALDVLSTEQRACLLLRVVRSHAYTEIAVILGIPESTARSHVYRARSRLAEVMGGTRDGGGS